MKDLWRSGGGMRSGTEYKMNRVFCRTFRKRPIGVLHMKSLLSGSPLLRCTPRTVSVACRSFCEVYKPNLQCTRYKSTMNKQSQSAEVNEE
jgi:hypothetical protein